MFENPGKTIKTLAKVVFFLEIIAGILYPILVSGKEGVVVLILALIVAFISFLPLYGFGELVENSTEIRRNTEYICREIEKKNSAPKAIEKEWNENIPKL